MPITDNGTILPLPTYLLFIREVRTSLSPFQWLGTICMFPSLNYMYDVFR